MNLKTASGLDGIPHHLYILSNDEIKKGDWFIRDGRLYNEFKTSLTPEVTIFIRLYPNLDLSEQWREVYISDCKKIIATTDNSLTIKVESNFLTDGITIHKQLYKYVTLPQLPQSLIEHFINEYNEDNVISKVLVEFEEYGKCVVCQKQGVLHCNFPEECTSVELLFKIKLNQSNEISIVTQQKEETLAKASLQYRLSTNNKMGIEQIAFEAGAKWREKELFHREEVISLIEQALTFKPTRELGSLVTAQREIWGPNFRTWIEQHVK